jgi:hypothetical protein
MLDLLREKRQKNKPPHEDWLHEQRVEPYLGGQLV